MNTTGNSDPGTSGLLSPFAKIDGLYFNNEEEPDDFYFRLMKDLEKRYEDEGITFIKCDFESASDFYEALKEMEKYANDNISFYGTSREGHYEIVINDDTDMDDNQKDKPKEEEKK